MKTFLGLILLISFTTVNAQEYSADSSGINKKINRIFYAQSAAAGLSYAGLYSLWYSQQPQSRFHFFDDSREWAQMDKAGHSFSAYWINAANTELYRRAGASRNKALCYGAISSWGYMAVIEVMDGFSSAWGASASDLAANTIGCGLFTAQELALGTQVAHLKFSYSPSPYAAMRPEVLGSSWNEKLLKDYNGQTYWLSLNAEEVLRSGFLPPWLNVAVGYSIDGFTGGHDNAQAAIPAGWGGTARQRQYYLSLDADLSRINTHRKWLKTVLFALNAIKIPAPSIELCNGNIKMHYLYY